MLNDEYEPGSRCYAIYKNQPLACTITKKQLPLLERQQLLPTSNETFLRCFFREPNSLFGRCSLFGLKWGRKKTCGFFLSQRNGAELTEWHVQAKVKKHSIGERQPQNWNQCCCPLLFYLLLPFSYQSGDLEQARNALAKPINVAGQHKDALQV